MVRVQAARLGVFAVWASIAHERVVATYEQAADDPRVNHQVVVTCDAWGTPRRAATIAYARRGAATSPAQARQRVIVRDDDVVDFDEQARFELGAPVAGRTFELGGLAAVGGRVTPAQLRAPTVAAALAAPRRFEESVAADVLAARVLSWTRRAYWDDARTGALPQGAVGRIARVHHDEEACFTPGLLAATLGPRADEARLTASGYVLADDHWWRAGPVQVVGGNFELVVATRRGDGAVAAVARDADEHAVIATTDALGLVTTFEPDPYLLAPARTIDPNGAVVETVFDPLGVVVATGHRGAIDGQPWGNDPLAGWTPPAMTLATLIADPGSYLGPSATAIWYDASAAGEGAPPVQVELARAGLVHDGAGGTQGGPIEVTVGYLDGRGLPLQSKARAGTAAAPTWRVSGGIVRDRGGQPTRSHEPSFSVAVDYEPAARTVGVSTTTLRDGLGRPVRVDLPNGTFASWTYRAWSTEEATPGDNVLASTYRLLREGRSPDDPERAAYEHARHHAGTSRTTFVDPRGVVCAVLERGDASAGDRFCHHELDAMGQVMRTIDPRGLVAFAWARDLAGRTLEQRSVDAGSTWAMADAFDRPVWTWDGRGFAIERGFDRADRPMVTHVRGGDGPVLLDHRVEEVLYGDTALAPDLARAANLLGRAVEVRDAAGVTRTRRSDPAGAPRISTRRLRVELDDIPDWRGAVAVAEEAFETEVVADAFGRVVDERLADGTRRSSTYHPGGALAAVQLTTPDGALIDAPLVDGMVRDAHGRLAAARLGNGCAQAWGYDRDTGRLVAQDATMGGRPLQRLRFSYDPDGKIVRALDLAQDGPGAVLPSPVSARRDFRYDAHGRLVEATGRVHQALLARDHLPGTASTISGTRHLSLDNGAALERYTQRFAYDPSGNLVRVQHAGATASWSTDVWIDPGSNRAVAALDANGLPVVDPAGAFDAAGNTVALSHLRQMAWSWRGCLASVVTIARPGDTDDGEAYAYGADRQRVRKVSTRVVTGDLVETREVVYLGDQQRVRVHRGDTLVLERWTTHVGDGARRVAVVDRHVVDVLGHEVDAIGPARVRYHLTTPQGSTALELDEAGGLVSYEEYLPHGGSAFLAGDSARDVARRDVRYAGQERDRATGLHAYRYRYYAPWLGRWLSPDPIGPADDLNLYQFVGGDPIAYVDPDGTDREPVTVFTPTSSMGSYEPFEDQLRRAAADEAAGRRATVDVLVDDAEAGPTRDVAPAPTTEPTPRRPARASGPQTAAEITAAVDEMFASGPLAARLAPDASASGPLVATHQELLALYHQVEAQQENVAAANALVDLAIDKWGPGKVSKHLASFDFMAVTRRVRQDDVKSLLGAVEGYLAGVGQAKTPSAFANASAGFGTGITFGLAGRLSRAIGTDDAYNEAAGAFRYGSYGGVAVGVLATGGLGAARYGAARATSFALTGAGVGVGYTTLQTGAAALDGQDVTWGSYLEQAGTSALYGAYGGNAFGLASPTGRAVLGFGGTALALRQGAQQVANGNYAQGGLDLGLAALGGYLTLRPPPSLTLRGRDSMVAEADQAYPQANTGAATGHTIATADEPRGPFSLLPESSLNARQRRLHAALQNQGDMTTVHKRAASMKDLLAIGRVTGDEYSMYTLRSERLIIRGYGNQVRASSTLANDLLAGKFGKWSGHTHPPGYSSKYGPGDIQNLPTGQDRSAVWSDTGPRPFFRDLDAELRFRRADFQRLYGH